MTSLSVSTATEPHSGSVAVAPTGEGECVPGGELAGLLDVLVTTGFGDDVTCESPRDILMSVQALRKAADRAEALLVLRAAEWADTHPEPGEGGYFDESPSLPTVTWDAMAEFGTIMGRNDEAGYDMVLTALELRHRLPKVWARLAAGEIEAWRARRITGATLGASDEIAAHIDDHVADIAHKVGTRTLDRLLDEARLRFEPEKREQEQLAKLDQRRVILQDQVSGGGVGQIVIDADLKDCVDFNNTLSRIAACLLATGSTDSLDVRRANAVGVLADPVAALAMLNNDVGPKPSKRLNLVVHLTQDSVAGDSDAGANPVGRFETLRMPLLARQIREWCGRADTHLTVTPVIDLNDHEGVGQYEIPNRLKRRVDLAHHTCVFPYCERPAGRCDHDHTTPHAEGGTTCICNLAPLCRRHHRLKTHRSWRYMSLEPGSYHWIGPHGQTFHRDNTGTTRAGPVTRTSDQPGARPVHPSGCFEHPTVTQLPAPSPPHNVREPA